LLARALASEERYAEAVREFESVARMRSDLLELLRQQRLAQAYFALGKYQRAQIHYWQSLNFVTQDLQALQIEEKLRFCEWMENYLKSLD
jgi:tetratricopeptide (TPR) repeat protein